MDNEELLIFLINIYNSLIIITLITFEIDFIKTKKDFLSFLKLFKVQIGKNVQSLHEIKLMINDTFSKVFPKYPEELLNFTLINLTNQSPKFNFLLPDKKYLREEFNNNFMKYLHSLTKYEKEEKKIKLTSLLFEDETLVKHLKDDVIDFKRLIMKNFRLEDMKEFEEIEMKNFIENNDDLNKFKNVDVKRKSIKSQERKSMKKEDYQVSTNKRYTIEKLVKFNSLTTIEEKNKKEKVVEKKRSLFSFLFKKPKEKIEKNDSNDSEKAMNIISKYSYSDYLHEFNNFKKLPLKPYFNEKLNDLFMSSIEKNDENFFTTDFNCITFEISKISSNYLFNFFD
jgi:hypothetical protein